MRKLCDFEKLLKSSWCSSLCTSGGKGEDWVKDVRGGGGGLKGWMRATNGTLRVNDSCNRVNPPTSLRSTAFKSLRVPTPVSQEDPHEFLQAGRVLSGTW